MATITHKGDALSQRIYRNSGFASVNTMERLSLIARHAVTLHRLYEDECNGHPAMGNPHIPIDRAGELQNQWDARVQRETKRLEKRIAQLARGLPNITTVEFNGDPRGAPVKLVTKDGSGDSWDDPRGWCVS